MPDKKISEVELPKEFRERWGDPEKGGWWKDCYGGEVIPEIKEIETFLSKVFKASEAQALEWVEKQLEVARKEQELVAGDYDEIDLIKHFVKNIRQRIKQRGK